MDQRLPDFAVAAPPDWRGLCEELGFSATDEAFAIWEERKALRTLLTAEADRAERCD